MNDFGLFGKDVSSISDGILEMLNINTGSIIKQGDTTELKYHLRDNDTEETKNLAGKPAKAYLTPSDADTAIYESKVTIDSDNIGRFRITQVLPAKQYKVEIVVTFDDQETKVYPSQADDPDSTLIITPSAIGGGIEADPKAYDVQVVRAMILEQIKANLDKIKGEKGDPGPRGPRDQKGIQVAGGLKALLVRKVQEGNKAPKVRKGRLVLEETRQQSMLEGPGRLGRWILGYVLFGWWRRRSAMVGRQQSLFSMVWAFSDHIPKSFLRLIPGTR